MVNVLPAHGGEEVVNVVNVLPAQVGEGGGRRIPTIPPGYVRRVRSLSSRSCLPAPGYMPDCPATDHGADTPLAVGVHIRVALFGRNPWVEALLLPPGPPSCYVW